MFIGTPVGFVAPAETRLQEQTYANQQPCPARLRWLLRLLIVAERGFAQAPGDIQPPRGRTRSRRLDITEFRIIHDSLRNSVDNLSYLGVDPKWAVKEVRRTTEAALDLWPAMLPDLLDEGRADALVKRLNQLPLVAEVRGQ